MANDLNSLRKLLSTIKLAAHDKTPTDEALAALCGVRRILDGGFDLDEILKANTNEAAQRQIRDEHEKELDRRLLLLREEHANELNFIREQYTQQQAQYEQQLATLKITNPTAQTTAPERTDAVTGWTDATEVETLKKRPYWQKILWDHRSRNPGFGLCCLNLFRAMFGLGFPVGFGVICLNIIISLITTHPPFLFSWTDFRILWAIGCLFLGICVLCSWCESRQMTVRDHP
jgi:hypothetical protein